MIVSSKLTSGRVDCFEQDTMCFLLLHDASVLSAVCFLRLRGPAGMLASALPLSGSLPPYFAISFQ